MEKKSFQVLPPNTNFYSESPFIQSQIELAMKNQSCNNLNLNQDQQNISSIFPQENKPIEQRKTKNSSEYQKQKKITIGNFFDCTDQADFFVIISKFVMLFNVDIDKMSCSTNMEKQEIQYIKGYKHESLLAQTNRKHIIKQFKKSVNWWHKILATLGDENRLFLIIQNMQGEEEKIQAKFLTNQNMVYAILSNMSTEQISDKKNGTQKAKKKDSTPISTKPEIDHNLKCEYLEFASETEKSWQKYERLFKYIDGKYLKFKSVLCIQKIKDRYTPLNYQLISYFSAKFKQMYYVAAYSQSSQKIKDLPPDMVLDIKGRKLNFCSSQTRSFVSSLDMRQESRELIQKFYQRYLVIDKIINAQIQRNPKLNISAVLQNELYISFYGIYYNFILLNGLEYENYEVMQQKILQHLIKQKNNFVKRLENQQKKVLHRKLGHYPQKIEIGSKLCCVCEKDNKKTRYKCQLCTHIYGRDICICLNHFKKYHSDPSKYIPKGVRKGALKMEIKQFNRKKVCEAKDEIKCRQNEQNGKGKTFQQIEEQWIFTSKNFQKELYPAFFLLSSLIEDKSQNGISQKINPKQITNQNQMQKKLG